MSRGYCKCCSSPYAKEINKRLAAKQPAPQIVQWLAGKGFKVTRQTVYNHAEHVTDPKVTFVAEAQRLPAIKVSNDEFLQAIKDAAYNKVVSSPDDVTIEQGIKAAGLLEARREKSVNILLAVAALVTDRQPQIIEGEYRELLTGRVPAEVVSD